MPSPLVAIIGRPNVGKSTIFNRLTKSKSAIVDDEPGVTRDRLYGTVEWKNRVFNIVDTGGIILSPKETIEIGMRDQALFAAEQANLILLVVDAQTGITQDDLTICKLLLKLKRNLLIIANKSDNPTLELNTAEFYQLGAGEPIAISALHSRNLYELLDTIISKLPFSEHSTEEKYDCRVAIVGRPNVGKSSLVNLLLGEERMLVSEKAGTTRDSVDTLLKFQKRLIVLTDTAGLRRKSKVKRGIEQFSMIRSFQALSNSDVGIVLLDATSDFGNNEDDIFQFAWEHGVGLVVAMNKWDAIPKNHKTIQDVENRFFDRYPYLEGVPFRTISVLQKQRVFKVLEDVLKVADNRNKRIITSELNEWLHGLWENRPPPSIKGKHLKLHYVVQQDIAPPKFLIFCKYPELLPEQYKKFIEKQMRMNFEFWGVPIKLEFRRK